MKNVRIFFTLSSVLIVAASLYGVSADARKTSLDQCLDDGRGKAECACESALQKGTKKALRDFLKFYRNADTACNALALTATVSDGGGVGNSSGASSNGASSNGASSNGASSNGASSNGGSAKENNGHGNGDQDAPGNSGDHNNAENSEHTGQGNSGNHGGNGNNH